jgi:hypothetical protein
LATISCTDGKPLDILIGYDPREHRAAHVCAQSIRRRTSRNVAVQFLRLDDMMARGLLYRPFRTVGRQRFDIRDGKPFSTDFSFTRFLVPWLMRHDGIALYVDCDFLFLDDVAKLFALADDRYAVQVVQHRHDPVETEKMDGLAQTRYPRKNWSSCVLWNCRHAGHARLSLGEISTAPGLYLHGFSWLEDHEIGALPTRWNWLAGITEGRPDPSPPSAVHFTLGTPDTPGHECDPYAMLWWREAAAVNGVEHRGAPFTAP